MERVEQVLSLLPAAECTERCAEKLQGAVEYALMYPYLSPDNKEKVKRMVPQIEDIAHPEPKPLERCAPYYKDAVPFELWFVRHSFSCNNNIGKDPLRLKFITKTKYDPGLTSQGIVDALLFNAHNLRLNEIDPGPLKVFVSTSMRTWQTAVLLYAKHRPLNLYVVPGLAEAHSHEMEWGNVPAPLPQQQAVLQVFIEQVYLQYGVRVHAVAVFAYNDPSHPLMVFPATQIKEFHPTSSLESMSTRDKKRNAIDPVCSILQCKTHPLREVVDPPVDGTWSRVFTKYDPQKTLFVALERVLQSDLFNTRDGKRVYLCTTHSRAMQSALTNHDFSLLSDPMVRDALNGAAIKHHLGKTRLKVDCPLPPEETPQTISSSHNMWQLRFFGALRPDMFCLSHMTMFQGLKKFTTNLGKRLDFNNSCANDATGLPVLIRRAFGMPNRTVRDPSNGQTRKARNIVNRLKLAWHTRRYFNPRGG